VALVEPGVGEKFFVSFWVVILFSNFSFVIIIIIIMLVMSRLAPQVMIFHDLKFFDVPHY